MRKTVQFNVRVEQAHEPLARSVIDRIRRGGPAFREALEAFLAEEANATYVPRMEFDTRFRSLEAQIAGLREVVSETENGHGLRLTAEERRVS